MSPPETDKPTAAQAQAAGQLRATGFNPTDARRLQRTSAGEELGILLGVDVVGDHRQLQLIAQSTAERLHQRGFAGAHRTGDPQAQLAAHQLRNNREYSSAWAS